MTDEEIIEVVSVLKANDKTMKDNGISDNLWGKAVECITFLQFENAKLKSSLTHANEECLKWHERAQNLLKDSGGSISGYEKKISALQAENAALRARLGNAVEMPCKVGDTIYEATSVGIYEWEVESVYLRKNIFQANCVNKNDYKMHWNFIKADYCNEFEGRGRVRVNRLEAEARLAELKGGKE